MSLSTPSLWHQGGYVFVFAALIFSLILALVQIGMFRTPTICKLAAVAATLAPVPAPTWGPTVETEAPAPEPTAAGGLSEHVPIRLLSGRSKVHTPNKRENKCKMRGCQRYNIPPIPPHKCMAVLQPQKDPFPNWLFISISVSATPSAGLTPMAPAPSPAPSLAAAPPNRTPAPTFGISSTTIPATIPSEQRSDSDSTPIVAGVVSATIAGVALIVLAVFLKRRQAAKQTIAQSPPSLLPAMPTTTSKTTASGGAFSPHRIPKL